MKNLLISIGLLVSFASVSQQLQRGVIMPHSDSRQCCIFIPKAGLQVYNAPQGDSIGRVTAYLSFTPEEGNVNRLYFIDKDTQVPDPIDAMYLWAVDSEVQAIPFVERKEGAVRILSTKFNYWIKESELIAMDYKAATWPEFLLEEQRNLLGLFAKEPGLNLRSQPTTDSAVIKLLKGDLLHITLLNENEGLWYKVKVKKYKAICEGTLEENFIREYNMIPYRTKQCRTKFSSDKIFRRTKFSSPAKNFVTFVRRKILSNEIFCPFWIFLISFKISWA